jgi:hypothetical protein
MKALCEKAQQILPSLLQRGTVYLYALFERDDAPGKWDVVLSSEWSDGDAASATRYISDRLVPTLEKEELAALSRIAIIPSTAPAVALMASAINISDGHTEVVDCNFMGLLVKHAFVFRTQHPPTTENRAPETAISTTAS